MNLPQRALLLLLTTVKLLAACVIEMLLLMDGFTQTRATVGIGKVIERIG